jgi:hypothetical protein
MEETGVKILRSVLQTNTLSISFHSDKEWEHVETSNGDHQIYQCISFHSCTQGNEETLPNVSQTHLCTYSHVYSPEYAKTS